MDKQKPAPFAWMPEAMPGVGPIVDDMRLQWGRAHVAECIRRGLAGEKNWFFARQGVIAVGTPFDNHPDVVNFAAAHINQKQALVVMRAPKDAYGQD